MSKVVGERREIGETSHAPDVSSTVRSVGGEEEQSGDEGKTLGFDDPSH